MAVTDRTSGYRAELAYKAPCRVATTANITLSGTQTIDGVAVVAGNRVLVKEQSTAANNGIYEVSSGAWTRTKDFNSNDDIATGTRVYVHSGSLGVGEYVLTTAEPIVLGTSSIAFSTTDLTITRIDTVATDVAGVDETGATDSTSAVNSTIATMSASGGGWLRFPPGTYRFDGAIIPQDNVRIEGFRGGTIFQQYGQYLFQGPNDLLNFHLTGVRCDMQASSPDAYYACYNLKSHQACSFVYIEYVNYDDCTVFHRFPDASDTINTIYNEYSNHDCDGCVAFDVAGGYSAYGYTHAGDGTTTAINTSITWPEEFNSSVVVFQEDAARRLSQLTLTTHYTVSYSSSVLTVTLVTAAASGTRIHIWPAQPIGTGRRPISNNRWVATRCDAITSRGHQCYRWVDAETYIDERFVVNADNAKAYVFNAGTNRSSQAGDYAIIQGSIVGLGSGVSDVTTCAVVDAGPGSKSTTGLGIRVDGTWTTGGTNYAFTARDGRVVALTGTVTTDGSAVVAGSGTAFQDEITLVGSTPDRIVIEGTVYAITSIDSDTQLTLTSTAAAAAGVSASRQNNANDCNYDITWNNRGDGNTNPESRAGGRSVKSLFQTIDAPTTITDSGGATPLIVTSVEASTDVAVAAYKADRGSDAADSDVAYIAHYMTNDAGEVIEVAQDQTRMDDVSDGTEDARRIWAIIAAGSLTNKLQLTNGALYPVQAGGLDLGTASLAFEHAFLDGTVRFGTFASTDIADATHALNTANKYPGSMLVDVTNGYLALAVSSASSGIWNIFAPSTSVTPTT